MCVGIVHHPFLRNRSGRRIAAMAVDDQDAAKAGMLQAVQHIAQHRGIGGDTQRDGAGKGSEIRRQAVGQGREHRHAEWFGRLGRDAFGEDRIGGQRQAGMLLGAAQWQRAPVIVADPVLHHAPVHL